MKDYYDLDIEFPNVDFDKYHIKFEKVSNMHNARLYADGSQIELRIFYDDKSYLGEKMSHWVSTIYWEKFGSYIKISNENKNTRLIKIDLSKAKLITLKNSTSFYEDGSKFIKIYIDTVTFYWSPNNHLLNTAEFYLNKAGFEFIQQFYSTLNGSDGKFDFQRTFDMDAFYPIGKSEFRPEFNFVPRDSRNEKKAIIIKEPKLQFRYTEKIAEKEAILYGEVISLISSFFFHTKIDFVLIRIHLEEYTVTTKKIDEQNNIKSNMPGLMFFNSYMDFHDFLQEDWQPKTFLNVKKLSKAVELFTQALLVDDYSAFIIRYNIIEICNNQKESTAKFTETIKGKNKKEKYTEALNLLLQTISPEEHADFRKKWNSLAGKLKFRPMRSPLLQFFESQNLNPNEFPISAIEIKELRDNIIHGSLSKINTEQLKRANILLYRITGIIILNLMGIKKWELIKDIK